MKRRGFLKNALFLIGGAMLPKSLLLADTLVNPTEYSLKKYCLDSDTIYITRQIARYHKRFCEDLDQRIFELIEQTNRKYSL